MQGLTLGHTTGHQLPLYETIHWHHSSFIQRDMNMYRYITLRSHDQKRNRINNLSNGTVVLSYCYASHIPVQTTSMRLQILDTWKITMLRSAFSLMLQRNVTKQRPKLPQNKCTVIGLWLSARLKHARFADANARGWEGGGGGDGN
jgi:hypothetical protein